MKKKEIVEREIKKARKENEELDEQHIWNEIKESDRIIDITIPPSRFPSDGMKEAPLIWTFENPENEEEEQKMIEEEKEEK